MKKLLSFILLLIVLITTCSCNKQIIDLEYTFDSVHIYETGKCYKIKRWNDYDGDQLQVILEDGTVILLHSTDCALIKGECIFCKEHK